jgi:hypothetical protein
MIVSLAAWSVAVALFLIWSANVCLSSLFLLMKKGIRMQGYVPRNTKKNNNSYTDRNITFDLEFFTKPVCSTFFLDKKYHIFAEILDVSVKRGKGCWS